MEPEGRPDEWVGIETGRGLPQAPEEFRRELLRRLNLLDREIQALDSKETHLALLEPVETLRRMKRALQDRLSGTLDTTGWSQSRLEIVGLWREYRREFERLAAAWQKRHPARHGQRDRGPRW